VQRLCSFAVVFLCALPWVGCYQPSIGACEVTCNSADECPEDNRCGSDGYCHAPDDEDTCRDGGGGSEPVPRLIRNAYFSGLGSSFGMSQTGFLISTGGIEDGDLVLFIASIDNGGETTYPSPIAPGFTQLDQHFYGNDGQTYVVAWKIASGEPTTYAGTYGPGTPGVVSGASTVTLIAVSGADPLTPINASASSFDTGANMSPVVGSSSGVTTTVDHCLVVYASGADWATMSGTTSFTPPTGFTPLTEIADHGDTTWDWTAQQVDYTTQSSAGATGAIAGSMAGTHPGVAWTAIIAIAPRQ
jgi:hypothetical protein